MSFGNAGQDRAGHRVRRIAAGVAVAAIGWVSFAAAGATPAAAAPSGCSTAGLLGDTAAVDSIEAKAQQDFLVRLNQLRQSKGLGTLAWNGAIATHAIDWSATMSAQDKLHHARDTGAGDGVEPHQDYIAINSKIVADWRRLAENVGVSHVPSSCTPADLERNAGGAVASLHDAFVASSGHYKNMVGDHNQVGIGVHIDDDQLWVTVRFAKGGLPTTTPNAATVATPQTASYIDDVYRLFGGRTATAGERAHWAGTVQAGNRTALTSALAVTDSWAGARVADLYQKVLQRPADGAGRGYWLDQIRRGLRLEAVGVEFYASNEYFGRSGGTAGAWVTALYRDLMGRTADRSGLAYWVGQLTQGGQPRSAVAANFYRSNESLRDRAAELHHDVVGSALADPGLQWWANRLAAVGDVALAAELAATETFWSKAVG